MPATRMKIYLPISVLSVRHKGCRCSILLVHTYRYIEEISTLAPTSTNQFANAPSPRVFAAAAVVVSRASSPNFNKYKQAGNNTTAVINMLLLGDRGSTGNDCCCYQHCCGFGTVFGARLAGRKYVSVYASFSSYISGFPK